MNDFSEFTPSTCIPTISYPRISAKSSSVSEGVWRVAIHPFCRRSARSRSRWPDRQFLRRPLCGGIAEAFHQSVPTGEQEWRGAASWERVQRPGPDAVSHLLEARPAVAFMGATKSEQMVRRAARVGSPIRHREPSAKWVPFNSEAKAAPQSLTWPRVCWRSSDWAGRRRPARVTATRTAPGQVVRAFGEAMIDQGGGRSEQGTYVPISEIVSISASTASCPPGTRTPRPRGIGACGRTFSTQSANTLSAVMKMSHSGKYVAI